jgi:hypothetical protein
VADNGTTRTRRQAPPAPQDQATPSLLQAPQGGQNVEVKPLDLAFHGAWVPDEDPVKIGSANFATLQNMRYTNQGVQGVSGYTLVSASPLTLYPYLRAGQHYVRWQAGVPSSYVIVQVDDLSSSKLYLHTAAIPGVGSWSGPLWSDAAVGGLGRFALGPDGTLAYCNGWETLTWGSAAYRVASLLNYDGTLGTWRRDLSHDLADGQAVTLRRDSANLTTLLVGTTRPIQGITWQVSTPNTMAGAAAVYYWDGSTWQSVGAVTDGTAVAGATLAQSGTMSFASTAAVARVKWDEERLLYVYLVHLGEAGGTDNNLVVTALTVDTPMQPLVDVWDGAERLPILCTVNAQDFTLDILERSSATAPIGADVSALAAGEAVIILCDERMLALQLGMAGNNTNGEAATLTVESWTGTAWQALTTTDGTSDGSASLAHSGAVAWSDPGAASDVPQTLLGRSGYAYRLTWSATLTQSTQTEALGQILTWSISQAGEGYVVGDVGGIGSGNLDAGYTVTSVNGDGGILAFALGDAGSGYIPEADVPLHRGSGSGEDAQINITSTSSLGTAVTGVIIDTVTGIPVPRWSVVKRPPGYRFPFRFGDRVMIAGVAATGEVNRIDYCAAGRPDVWNGEDSSDRGKAIFLGDGQPVISAIEMTNRFLNQLTQICVVHKATQTWVIQGSSPDDFRTYQISSTIGNPAPLSLCLADIPSQSEGQTLRNVALWCSAKGPVLFDGTIVLPMRFPQQDGAISSVDCYFDPNDSRCIKTSLWEKVVGYYDAQFSEYNLLIPSGSSATNCNTWLVCDMRRRKWYSKVASTYPQIAVPVADAQGVQYVYGGLHTGNLVRLEYGNTWNGSAIAHVLETADLVLGGSVFAETLARFLRVAAMTDSGSGVVTIAHAANGSGTFTTLTTLTLAGSGRYQTRTLGINKRAFSHQLRLSCSTSDAARAPRLLGLGILWQLERMLER